jgi:hypothetical protein
VQKFWKVSYYNEIVKCNKYLQESNPRVISNQGINKSEYNVFKDQWRECARARPDTNWEKEVWLYFDTYQS